jgi:hypothetical protein
LTRARRLAALARESSPARRFAIAYLIGAVPSIVLFVWLVTGGSWHLFRFQETGDYFDVQASSLLHGHLSMPREVLGIEAFFGHHGHAFMYFGPFPALLRLPVVAFGDGVNGRLDALSLLIAYVVALAAAARIAWLLRGWVRPGDGFRRLELVATGGLALLFGVGSSLFFLGSRTLVYEEASAWALATSLLAYACLLSFLRARRWQTLAWACGWSMAAMLSRPAVGLGPVVALLLLALADAWSALKRRRAHEGPAPDADDRGEHSWWRWLAVAAGLPLIAYMAINWLKFGALVGVPFEQQEITRIDPTTQAVLRGNGGSLFGLKFVPTNLVTYLRPTGIRLQSVFPWVDFPDANAASVRFAVREPTASVLSAMPAWVLLALRGTVEIIRPRCAPPNASQLRLLLVGALVAFVPVLAIASQTERYTADLLPALLLAGVVGMYAMLPARGPNSPPRVRRPATLVGAVIVGASAIAGCWIMLGLALMSQRLYTANQRPAAVADLVSWQHSLPSIGGGQHELTIGTGLPPHGTRGQLFVVGNCLALYVSTGLPISTPELSHTNWVTVERTAAVGDRRFRVRIAVAPPGTLQPLVDMGEFPNPAQLVLGHTSGGGLVFAVHGPGTLPSVGRPFHASDGTETLEVDADQRLGLLRVHLGNRSVVTSYWGPADGSVDPRLESVRPDPMAAGTVVPLPDQPAPVCRSILR